MCVGGFRTQMAHAVKEKFLRVIPEEDDFYAALGCTEHSTVSIQYIVLLAKL